MKNVDELRTELADIFGKLREGQITPTEAAAFANLAGKMINSAKVQIEYAALRQEKPNIIFLDAGKPTC